jgi:hypothetical protein
MSVSIVSTSSFAMMCSNSSFEVLLHGEKLRFLQNNSEQQNSWNSLVSNPPTMLCDSFHAISCNNWWLIMSISDRQLVSLRASALFPCLLVSSRTFPSIFVEFWLDLVRFLDSYSFSVYSIFIAENSQFTKATETVMLVPKTLAWWWFRSLLESFESYPSGTFSSELQI